MIVTITTNPMLESTFPMAGAVRGRRNRITSGFRQVTGKGINVSRALTSLGVPTMAILPIESTARHLFGVYLDQDDIKHRFLPGPGPFRTGFVTIDGEGQPTAHYEQGPKWSPEALEATYEKLVSFLPDLNPSMMVLAGSLPPGLTPDFSAKIVRLFRSYGIPVVLDAVGGALTAGLRAGASFVKINREEFLETFGRTPATDDEYAAALQQISDEYGLEGCGVTDGSGAAFFHVEGRLFRATPPEIDVVNPVGSGDSLLAGWLYASSKETSLEERVRWAVAAGTANAENLAVASITNERTESLQRRVHIDELPCHAPSPA